ncbi:MAG: hypothetical protein ACRD4O_11360 [Bryobacteraceae bacterium]
MTDQLFLSIWLEPRVRPARLRHFEDLLRVFPFSQREQPQSTVAILAVDTAEPPLLERAMNGPADASELIAAFGGYSGEDIAYRVESWWDLWQFDGDWELTPARISLACFGPEFDSGGVSGHEDMRLDFGVDSYFLPQPGLPASGKLIESNIRSLLRLVHDLESTLPVAKRRLETESGENFSDRLQRVLAAGGSVQ